MLQHLLKTGKYSFVCFGGAVKHQDYKPQKTEEWGDDLIVYPVEGYGNQDQIRAALKNHKPDILWFMTDPRFYDWLWEMEDEIRPFVPMVYYHVWDNYPNPTFNKKYYDSNDVIVAISKVTDNIVKAVSPDVESHYLPHSVDPEFFKKMDSKEVEEIRKRAFPKDTEDRPFLFFWNSRNARRKQSGSLIWWFKEFLDEVGHDKARLLMHTDPKDRHGQDLDAIIQEVGLTNGEVLFSKAKLSLPDVAALYNLADCTMAVSDAEGFGLSIMESLACETPVIVNMTGGLQEQVTDGKKWFGIGIEPASKAIIGSQEVPFIYEDRVAGKDVINAMKQMMETTEKQRTKMGKDAKKYLEKNYNYLGLLDRWDELLTDIHEEHGSWDTRKGYDRWSLKQI
jgi:glycosyltransferase involved in cell wall biosynthesis